MVLKFFRLFVPLLLLSCQSAEKPELSVEVHEASSDSIDMTIPVVATLDALPFYYAEEVGMFESEGVDVEVIGCKSQTEVDTIFASGIKVMALTDLVRAYQSAMKGDSVVIVGQTVSNWQVLSSPKKDSWSLDSLKGKTIGVARCSASDYVSYQALQAKRIAYDEVYRPQVNDFNLRLQMLLNGQINSAVLAEPYSTLAKNAGCTILGEWTSQNERLGCLVVKSAWADDSLNGDLIKKVLRVYNTSVAELNKGGKSACTDVLRKRFSLKENEIELLELPKYLELSLPDGKELDKVENFLKLQGLSANSMDKSSLMTSQYLP